MSMRRRATRPLLAAAGALCFGASAGAEGFDCLIEAHATTQLATRELGVLQEILVQRGDLVEAGQVVAQLESEAEKVAVKLMRARTEMEAALEEAQVRADFATRRLARTEQLRQENTISDFEHDEAATDAAAAALQLEQVKKRQEIARLELEQAERQLERRTLRSPIEGVVVARLLQVGESVEDRPIMEIAQTDPLNVELIVPVSQLGTILVGDRAEIIPQIPNAEARTAVVKIVDRVVDAASGTFGVRLALPNPDHALPGGVRCEVRFLAP